MNKDANLYLLAAGAVLLAVVGLLNERRLASLENKALQGYARR
jgi:hypothetical protein